MLAKSRMPLFRGAVIGALVAVTGLPVVAVATAISTAAVAAAATPVVGTVLTSFRPGADDAARALADPGDGYVVVAGDAGGDFGVTRVNFAAGLADPSFGGDGQVTTDFGGRPDVANAVASGPSRTTVAAGNDRRRPGRRPLRPLRRPRPRLRHRRTGRRRSGRLRRRRLRGHRPPRGHRSSSPGATPARWSCSASRPTARPTPRSAPPAGPSSPSRTRPGPRHPARRPARRGRRGPVRHRRRPAHRRRHARPHLRVRRCGSPRRRRYYGRRPRPPPRRTAAGRGWRRRQRRPRPPPARRAPRPHVRHQRPRGCARLRPGRHRPGHLGRR